jgi:large subunit ribosomal protein L25
MTQELTLEVQPRTVRGKNANRRLRRQGKISGVVYGLALPPRTVELDRRQIVTMLREGATENSIFLLRMEGSEDHHTMIRELQVDPIDRRILHIDFQRIDLAQTVTVRIAVEIVGVPEGVKNEGGLLDFVTREVEVECLPTQIPDKVVLDVSELHVGQHAEIKDLTLPEGVTLADDPHRVVVSVAVAKAEVEEAAPAEGALVEAEPTEPEVIGRGKAEEEEEEGEDE